MFPYLAWLTQARSNSAGVAAPQHEATAAAYTTALATMPTLGELAAQPRDPRGADRHQLLRDQHHPDRTQRKADYARMWVQAATTMSTYQATAGIALASAPSHHPGAVRC